MTRSGTYRLLSLALLAALLPAAAGAAPLQIVLGPGLPAPVAEPVPGVLTLRLPGEETREVPVTVPGRVTVDLPAGQPVTAELAAAGLWLPAQVVTAGAAGAAARLEPWRTAVIEARLVEAKLTAGRQGTSPPAEVPAELTALFSPTPGAKLAVPEAQLRCPVIQGSETPNPKTYGTVRCELPAAAVDLRLRARGHRTLHFWDLRLAAGETRDLGSLALEAGASLVGWVEAPARGFAYPDVEVHLRPQGATADTRTMGRLGLSIHPDGRGFFELFGLDPGAYQLEVRHPDYAAWRRGPIPVAAGAETAVGTVRLSPPVRLQVVIDPPRHPRGTPWEVQLSERSAPGRSATVASGPAGEEGRWGSPPLAPGDYQVTVGDGKGSRWHFEEVTVGEEASTLVIPLPVARVEGTVRLGGEPLAATLHFGGKHGADRVIAKSDESGRFHALLPERPRWTVDVVEESLGIETRFPAVEPATTPEPGRYRVRLEVPGTALEGTVVDTQDRPVEEAVVSATATGRALGEGSHTQLTTDEEGRFRVRGFPPGPVQLEAEGRVDGRLASSEVTPVTIDEELPVTGLTLVLRLDLEITGQVVGPQGLGVPGAQVVPLPNGAGGIAGAIREVATDPSGAFRLRLPADIGELLLSVYPPGYGARQYRLAPTPEPLLLPVDPAAGRLVIHSPDGEPLSPTRLWVFQDHAMAVVPHLWQWAEAHGARATVEGSLVFPALAPGRYTVCHGGGRLDLGAGGRPPLDASTPCASGELAAGGELVLTLPAAPDGEVTR
jgi:hypothetical protein